MHASRSEMGSTESVTCLRDEELIAALHRLLRHERKLSTAVLEHLGEVDARGLYRQHAYSSMFEYCVHALHLSEAEAYLRIRGARLGRRFPRVLQMLAAGELHLSAVKLLSPVLTEDNCDHLLDAARLKSKRDVEWLLAQRSPQPGVSSVIRKLPQPELVPERAEQEETLWSVLASSTSSERPSLGAQPRLAPTVERQTAVAPQPQLSSRAIPAVSPLGRSRYKLQLTASQELHDKLRQAQDLMRHELPDGDIGQVLERALDLLIAERMKRRFGQSAKPRVVRQRVASKAGGRHVPHEVRRAVLARDGARCSYVSADGKRCEQRGGLELHHEKPFGRGGPATVGNIRVLCRAHNQLLAERDYGAGVVRQSIERARRERTERQREREPSDRPT